MNPEIRFVGQHAVIVSTAQQEIFGQFLEALLGPDYRWDFDSGVLSFTSSKGTLSCDTFPVASIAVDPATILWRREPLTESEAPYFRGDAAEGFRQFGEQQGLQYFIEPEVPYHVFGDPAVATASVGHDIIAAGYELFGLGIVFYQAPFNAAGSRIVWGLANFRNEQGPVEVPQASLSDVLVALPRLLPDTDNSRWSLDGIAQFFEGVQAIVEENEAERTVHAEFLEPGGKRHVIDVRHDDDDRVSTVKMELGGHS